MVPRFAALVVLLSAFSLSAQQNAISSSSPIDPATYSAMRWRLLGPYRAGRVSAVAGVPGDPTTYYMGLPGGGVWKTTDAGRVWKPIFDSQDVASIGDVAVAPSNPNIVIVGTGEQTNGDGVYRSTDAGATWTNIGLRDSHYISTVIIDPKDPNIILVGVLGHPILGRARSQRKSRRIQNHRRREILEENSLPRRTRRRLEYGGRSR